MRLITLAMIFMIITTACRTTKVYVTVPLTKPPEAYNIPEIQTDQDLIRAYQQATMKIARWQTWYNINVNTNHFNYNERAKSKRQEEKTNE